MKLNDVFKGTAEKQAVREAINKIEHSIDTIKNITKDPRASIRVKKSLEDLKWKNLN